MDTEGTAEPGPQEDTEQSRAYRAELMREVAMDVRDVRVLDVMGRLPRHFFVPRVSVRRAYENRPMPIGYGQTISQPTIVAIMTEALELTGRERVLEIGSGSGYQAAILAELASEVFTIELVPALAEETRARLQRLGYANVHVRAGDGHLGWPEHAPFDRIVATAAPEEVPRALLDQLSETGILVLPVGPRDWAQSLLRYRKHDGRLSREDLCGVQFVPMLSGRATGAE
jgi:protein-L-isoaspartate(D-aspartate) O-methyltransferase